MGKKIAVKLAFYKGKGDITDKIIRMWTKSKFSHVELVIENDWISISPRTLRLEKRSINVNEDNWEFINVEIDLCLYERLLNKYNGCKYDWLGIFLSQFIKLNIENPDKLFCSEWCAMVLGLNEPNTYSPGDLFNYLNKVDCE